MSPAPIQASIQAKDAVTAGKRFLSAWVPHQSGCSYAWEIVNGRILMGSKGTHVSFEAGAAGELELICTISNGSGKTVSRKIIHVLATLKTPEIYMTEFVHSLDEGNTASVDEIPGCTYEWKAFNATITSGAGSRLITFTAGNAGNLMISCTVTNAAGEKVTGWAVRKISGIVQSPDIYVPDHLVAHREGYIASVKNQPGCTYTWTVENGRIISGENTSTLVFATDTPGTLTLSCVMAHGNYSAGRYTFLNVSEELGVPKILGPAFLIAGSENYEAHLETANSNVNYQWSLSSGEILETGFGYVKFKAGPRAGIATLTCTARFPDGTVKQGRRYIPVEEELGEPEYTFFPPTPNRALKSDTVYIAYVNAKPGYSYKWSLENGELLSNPQGTFMKFKTGRYGQCRIECSSQGAHQGYSTSIPYALDYPAGVIFNLSGLPEGLAQTTAIFGPNGFEEIALSGIYLPFPFVGRYEFVGQGLWFEYGGNFYMCEGSPYENTYISGEGLFQSNSSATPTKGLKINDIELVEIQPAEFSMGSNNWMMPSSFAPAHSVQITKPFFISRFETTQALWISNMGSNPSAMPTDDQVPVNNVSCEDIALFLETLNAATHMTRPAGFAFRLPTEAEWEWATRGETRDALFAFGDNAERLPLYGHSYGVQCPQPVGTCYPNRFGLHDTYGNVAEWVQDWFEPYATESQTDPQGPKIGVDRIYRGGYWGTAPEMCNHFERGHAPDHRSDKIGFRLVLAETSSK